jgi:1,4-dihydroxy-2-naphthoate octaprenyltransferase
LTHCIAFYMIFLLLDGDIVSIGIVGGLLYSTEFYKDIKKSELIGGKSLYVSFMWTASTVILPCILHDNNLSIFHHPGDYLPCFLNIFAGTNMADIQDIHEDAINQVNTLPVKLGKDQTVYIILLSLSLSSILFGINQNYLSRPIINSVFEIQNAILSAVTCTL